jgi:acetyltransferase
MTCDFPTREQRVTAEGTCARWNENFVTGFWVSGQHRADARISAVERGSDGAWAHDYAILVRSDLKGRGLGWLLMQMIIEYARGEGLRTIEGQVLAENTAMLAMCKELGFDIAPDPDDPDTSLVKLAIRNSGVGL